MRRVVASQFAHRRGRAMALGAAILVATVSFVLLTSAVNTGTLQVRGAIAKNWRTAYDVLVRPTDSFTRLERQQSLVSENYVSGIFGGITIDQWREVLAIPGVEVAAPIANIGYIVPSSREKVVIDRYLNDDPVQLYRIRLTWQAERGLSTYPGGVLYVYYTRIHRFRAIPPPAGTLYEIAEVVPGSRPARVCPFGFLEGLPRLGRSPADWTSPASSYLMCFSALSPSLATRNLQSFEPGRVGTITDAPFPMLLAAIDPEQEQKLTGLGGVMVEGRYLLGTDRANAGTDEVTIPVIAANRTYVDASLRLEVERLIKPQRLDVPRLLASRRAYPVLSRLPGRVVGRERRSAQLMYRDLLARFMQQRPGYGPDAYWTVSPVSYRTIGGRLAASVVSNPDKVWKHPSYRGFFPAPPGNQDVQLRGLEIHPLPCSPDRGCVGGTALRLVGRFDPARLPGFNQLARVPLESYYPPRAAPADPSSEEALGGKPLLPSMNLGGYVAQPPFMFTTLQAAQVFMERFEGNNAKAPISVIRVRVAGVTGPDDLSQERIRTVAEEITERTGLAVDVTAGSSPTAITIEVPAGNFGRPALTLQEGWVKKGVSVAILDALDRKSLVLFILVLVTSVLFLANGALASARTRRSEIGTLRCLGWSRGELFQLVLAEMGLVSLAAGLVGAGIAAGLVKLLSLNMPMERSLVVPPVALLIALVAGFVPAWRASRVAPLDAVRPAVSERGFAHEIRSVLTLVWANLRRVPGRTVLGAGGLFVGVAALTLILAVNMAFRGILVGTLLGNAISAEVRGVDLLTLALVIALGGLAVADVLFLNIRERGAELGLLRATGWEDRELATIVALEGAGIGVLGSVPGAAVGITVAWSISGFAGGVVVAGSLAALTGVAVAVLLSLIPASLVGRLTPASVLAEEQ